MLSYGDRLDVLRLIAEAEKDKPYHGDNSAFFLGHASAESFPTNDPLDTCLMIIYQQTKAGDTVLAVQSCVRSHPAYKALSDTQRAFVEARMER